MMLVPERNGSDSSNDWGNFVPYILHPFSELAALFPSTI
jgi:hypothetical protein